MANPFSAETELLVLRLLRNSFAGLHGLQLVSESDGKLKRGTVYVTLGRLEEKGFVESREERRSSHFGLPRSIYRITGAGQKVLTASELMGASMARI